MRLLLLNQYDRLLAKFKAIASDCARDAADWKSLLYETERTLCATLPIFVAACLNVLIVVPRSAIRPKGSRWRIWDFGVRASKCTVQLAREVLVRTVLSWISAC